MNANGNGRRGGFSLVEILVVVAIVAILSATMAPLVVKYLHDARRARALRDSRTLGQAILTFHLDTGRWPVNDDGDPAGELSRLVGLPLAQVHSDNIPDGHGAPGAGNWDGGGDGGLAGALEDHLIGNRSARLRPIYDRSATAPEPPGWNGPYLTRVPLDPWGHPYVCNVRYLDGGRVTGVTAAAENDHAVFCLSAGPDARFNTAFADDTELAAPGGDDIGWAIQADQTP